ncbi:MAG: DHCW motif cupin fold protein [Terriglobia bacterium]
MKLGNLPVGATNWSELPVSVQSGGSGTATARTRQLGEIRLRLVDYTASYIGDSWCSKGHIVFIVAGALVIEHQNGHKYALTPGMIYHVADGNGSPHRARSESGATIFVID